MTKRHTPAGTGTTMTMQRAGVSELVYPRRCGFYAHELFLAPVVEGIPPHVRGLLAEEAVRSVFSRNTPAVRGLPMLHRPAVISAEYPRMCGVYSALDDRCRSHTGITPHVRGLQHWHHAPAGQGGNTPAGAGFTAEGVVVHFSDQEYPRRCGVYTLNNYRRALYRGIPPHLRGLRRGTNRGRAGRGNTPAGAGFTRTSWSIGCWKREYPRLYGVYMSVRLLACHGQGIPPQMRGLPLLGDIDYLIV